MDTTTSAQVVIDYSDKLTAINDNLVALNQHTQLIANMFYWFLVVGSCILLCMLFYKFLKYFI